MTFQASAFQNNAFQVDAQSGGANGGGSSDGQSASDKGQSHLINSWLMPQHRAKKAKPESVAPKRQIAPVEAKSSPAEPERLPPEIVAQVNELMRNALARADQAQALVQIELDKRMRDEEAAIALLLLS